MWDWSDGRVLDQRELTPDQVDERFYGIVTDVVGTPTELYDPDGEIVWRARTTVWGATVGSGSVGCPLRFPGQYADDESGLHYNYFRYYDPETSRYTSPDPLGLDGGPDPAAYVSNPLFWTDPLGLTPCVPGRSGALNEAKRDLGIPRAQHPESVTRVPMKDRAGRAILDDSGRPIMTREYTYVRSDGSRVVIQDHGAGHQFGQGGVGDQPPHFNVRPPENTRTGHVPGTSEHYPFVR